MEVKSILQLPEDLVREVTGILMENSLYLELPLEERCRLLKEVLSLYPVPK